MTANQLRSVSGYTGLLIGPIEDGDVCDADLRHMAWLFAHCFPVAVEIFEFVLTVCVEAVTSLGVVPDVEVDAEIAAGLGFTMEII